MGNVNEVIVSNNNCRVWDKVLGKWKRYSWWTKASDVELDSGDDLQTVIDNLQHKTTINLLNSTLKTTTTNGVTCTANGDGTYTLNGTATNDASFVFRRNIKLDPNVKYKIVGCPSGGSATTYKIGVYGQKSATSFDGQIACTPRIGNTIEKFDPNNTLYPYGYGIQVVVYKNTTVTNLTVKPMLTTDFTATYDDYVQYSGPDELNKNVADLYPVKHRTITNLMNVLKGTKTANGITCTDNGDGTFTVRGTATADTRIPIEFGDDINAVIPNGKTVKLVGCPKGGTRQSYFLYTQNINHNDYGDGVIFNWDTGIGAVAIFVQKGRTVNDLLYKPMLTTDLTATYDDFVQYSGDGELNENVAEHEKAIEQINNNLTAKVSGEITNYTSVENLAYDGTNKKIMLKVAGADTPIPFSNEIQSATQVSGDSRTLSASCKKGDVFVATGAKYGGAITYANATVLAEYNTGSFGTAIVKAQANGTITVGNWYGTSYMYKLNI